MNGMKAKSMQSQNGIALPMKVVPSRSIAEEMRQGHGEHVHDQNKPPPVQGPREGPCRPPHPHPQPSFQLSLAPRNRAPPRHIDHTYRDYSNFPLGELPKGKKVSTNFPSKLHQILSTPVYSHVSLISGIE